MSGTREALRGLDTVELRDGEMRTKKEEIGREFQSDVLGGKRENSCIKGR